MYYPGFADMSLGLDIGYLEDPMKMKNDMVKLLGTEIIAFMLDCLLNSRER